MQTIELISKNLFETLSKLRDEALVFLLEISGTIGKKTLLFLLENLGKENLKSVRNDTLKAQKVQENLLNNILSFQKDTEYGQKYNFAKIQSIDEFCLAHPLTTYEHYRSIIEDIAETGDHNQLVAEPILLLQQTSGTTGASKLIPRTNSLAESLQKAFLAATEITRNYYLNNKSYSECVGLAFFNTSPQEYTPSGIPKGAGSSERRQFKLLQKIASLYFCSPASIFLIADSQVAYYCHWLFALSQPDIFYISANFASNILEALQVLEQQWEFLLEDLNNGQINKNLKIDTSIRKEIEKVLKPNPQRALFLQLIFEQGFRNILPKIWSSLSYLQCITTGSMELYKERLSFYTGNIPIYSGNFGASEAWLGLNLEPEKEKSAYVITPHSAFFEFIPLEQISTDKPNTVRLTSLVVGESYEIAVTTIAGLYRYRLGDIIKCVGYYNQSPIVEFLYRQGSLLNIAGEKVSENTIFTALTLAIKKLGSDYQLIDYTTSISTSSPMRYIIYVELSEALLSQTDLTIFISEIEEVISKINVVYYNLRQSNAIGLPEIKIVESNSFKDLKSQIISKSKINSQFKMPRLLKNDTHKKFLESKIMLFK